MANAVVPASFKDLFTKIAFAHVVTRMSDDSPQVTLFWCDYDGALVWLNSAKGRL